MSEADVDEVITDAGGCRAHVDADQRDKPGADYLLNEAVIELKFLDDEGLEKTERQKKVAALFGAREQTRPVVVIDREKLPVGVRRDYDRILEGPIKNAVSTARKQLRQTRAERPGASVSVLFIVNNGYTSLDHEALLQMVAHRARNDTKEIDAVVVAGCYFYSDTFDSFFLWPINYVPINRDRIFISYQSLREAWDRHAERFMTEVVSGQAGPECIKEPVADTSFTVKGVTYVKPAPPMGNESSFFVKGRPRQDTTGHKHYPAVATTFPDMNYCEWNLFRETLTDSDPLLEEYEKWQAHRASAEVSGTALRPFVPMAVTHGGWVSWCGENQVAKSISTIRQYANDLFETKIRATMASARMRQPSSIVPSLYVLAVTEEIGQDRANDVSHIAILREMPNSDPVVRVLAENVQIFHEYALALACAHAVAVGIECVLWQKDLRYAWV